ncbi:MAG: SUMF1/EgtB/PvdO family nonheme iron enzyme [Deltaproteobacteria bacterium]|nr:SUMF1/EgtB/PvdO family nonheme iron enzyme [Deltaproteobacteria bacterium]
MRRTVIILGLLIAMPAMEGWAGEDAEKSTSKLKWLFSKPTGLEFTRSEVTVEQYRRCVRAGTCREPNEPNPKYPFWAKFRTWGVKGREKHPVNFVDWDRALAFCSWAGGRLPTEAEWRAEASDEGRRRYAWGDDPLSCRRAVIGLSGEHGCGKDSTWPVCSKPLGFSVSGLCDMTGNVYEWTSTPSGKKRVICGGGFSIARPHIWRNTSRTFEKPWLASAGLGIRCVRPPQKASTYAPVADGK